MPRKLNIWDRVVKTETCWLWVGPLNHAGYGMAGKQGRAHRAAYEEIVGPIPEGLTLDHLCRKRNCVRPDHLEPVTQKENTLRGTSPSSINAIKTHCNRGHEFTPENTLSRENGTARCCRTCNVMHQAAYRERQKRRAS